MADQAPFELYRGDGTTLADRQIKLPGYQSMAAGSSPQGYVASTALRDAVNVALSLGQPLLLTGEPGTGKTRLAYSVAHELGLGDPKIFHTKTTSNARDLFYRYDSLAHFHDAQLRKKENLDIRDYITYEALGKAIIDSDKRRSVVLIDEIDKAPRDLPNDVLYEFERMAFNVKETGEHYVADQANRPILILTSNSEKNLPDAFLRRVVYYHIPFPDQDTLERIVKSRLQFSDHFHEQMVSDAIEHFVDIRENRGLRKPPATAELLSWIHILDQEEIDIYSNVPDNVRKLAMSYSILVKNREDLEKMVPSTH